MTELVGLLAVGLAIFLAYLTIRVQAQAELDGWRRRHAQMLAEGLRKAQRNAR